LHLKFDLFKKDKSPHPVIAFVDLARNNSPPI